MGNTHPLPFENRGLSTCPPSHVPAIWVLAAGHLWKYMKQFQIVDELLAVHVLVALRRLDQVGRRAGGQARGIRTLPRRYVRTKPRS